MRRRWGVDWAAWAVACGQADQEGKQQGQETASIRQRRTIKAQLHA